MLDAAGETIDSTFAGDVPLTDSAKEVVGVPHSSDWATTSVDGDDYRVYTVGFRGPIGAVQIARGLDEVDAVLDDVRQRTLILVFLVSLAAAAMGWLIAGTVTAPVRRLTKAAEDVGTSGRLDVDVPGTGSDEVGRLGAAFRRMLDALAFSRAEQQRLVQDAGHELRTPLTSLRTNLSVLRRHPDMEPVMQRQILDDLDSEVVELTDLVNELVTVASGDLTDQPIEALELGELASDVATRVSRRRSREVTVHMSGDPSGRLSIVNGPRAGLDRAIANLIDNACKFDQSGGPIEVIVAAGSLTVLDRGPGIPETDLTKVFDRFHRADTARRDARLGARAGDRPRCGRTDGRHRAGGEPLRRRPVDRLRRADRQRVAGHSTGRSVTGPPFTGPFSSTGEPDRPGRAVHAAPDRDRRTVRSAGDATRRGVNRRAIVVGAGPNGLVAAITLARAGWAVTVYEAAARRRRRHALGGTHRAGSDPRRVLGDPSARRRFAGVPGDRRRRSARPSTAWSGSIPRSRWPIRSTAAAPRSCTARSTRPQSALGADAAAYRRLFGPFVDAGFGLTDGLLSPLTDSAEASTDDGPLRCGRDPSGAHGGQAGFDTDEARGLFAGLAAHSFLSLGAPITAGYGLMLGVLGHVVGWPLARGGSQQIADALVAVLEDLGGTVECGHRVESLAELPPNDAVLLDVTPRQVLALAGDALPSRYARTLDQVPVRARRVQGRLGARRADPVDERRLRHGPRRSTSAERSARSPRRNMTCSAVGSPSAHTCSSRSRACSTRVGRRLARTPSGPTATCRTARPST